jgi:hypothetical protein
MAKMDRTKCSEKPKVSEQRPVVGLNGATHQTEPRLAGDEA